jgi:hypothetical protein
MPADPKMLEAWVERFFDVKENIVHALEQELYRHESNRDSKSYYEDLKEAIEVMYMLKDTKYQY